MNAVATANTDRPPLLEVRGLRMHFPITEGVLIGRKLGEVKAVDGVDFAIRRGETLGLVGESGCGKTTTGRCILRLERPTAGEVRFNGVDILALEGRELLALRRRIQVIFQDPYSSLNPRMKVGEIIAEPIRVHGIERDAARRARRVGELLSVCGLDPKFADRYPHEMSGGQRQRVGIARALALEPEFIVCDEAVSALDVSIQAQIINLLEGLREQFNLTYLFIAHDLSVVRHLCQRVAVMYLGRIVELAASDELFDNPLHPYTQALLAAVPVPDPEVEGRRGFRPLAGEVPSPINPPPGCVFHPRCPMAVADCQRTRPELREIRPGHWVACSQVDPPAWREAFAQSSVGRKDGKIPVVSS
ncbi:MAG: ATP-binding cassette domain-containing protein [Alphaproteobacteria bacterium]|nr:ATP-binding cassette domain-containing protein [Alphaproteobacteria bacterium]